MGGRKNRNSGPRSSAGSHSEGHEHGNPAKHLDIPPPAKHLDIPPPPPVGSNAPHPFPCPVGKCNPKYYDGDMTRPTQCSHRRVNSVLGANGDGDDADHGTWSTDVSQPVGTTRLSLRDRIRMENESCP